MYTPIAVLFLAMTAAGFPAEALDRVWTNKEGKQIMGSLEKIEDDTIYLLSNRKTFALPLDSLSLADQKYCENIAKFGRFWEELNQGRWFIFTLDDAHPIALDGGILAVAKLGEYAWKKDGKIVVLKSTGDPARTFEFRETLTGYHGRLIETGDSARLYQAQGPVQIRATVAIARPPLYRIQLDKGSGWISDIDGPAKSVDVDLGGAILAEGEQFTADLSEPAATFSPWGSVLVPGKLRVLGRN